MRLNLFLLRLGSAHRTNLGALAAVFAFGRIDLELGITLFDRSLRTFGLAGSTADAIFIYFIRHSFPS
jgi:hypothetical protein